MPRVESQRGADFAIYINGQVFGVVSSLDWEATTGAKTLRGIDLSTPFEIAPGAAHISGSMSLYRLQDSAGLEGAGIMPVESQIPRARYFDIQVVNRVTETVILRIPKAMAIRQQWRIASKELVQGSFTFQGLGWNNEF